MDQREHISDKKEVKKVTTKVQKWGNSLAIRIPKNIAEQIKIDQSSEVELYVKNDILTIKPTKKKVSLEDLLSKVTDENRHKEINFGMEGDESF